MRISADPDDPDFNLRVLQHGRVTLDGELLKNCFACDPEAGTAECYGFVNGKHTTVTRRGKVEITYVDEQ